ncbi:MAG: zinc ribbon domain-containing protein [Pseudomonadota bacterium]
MTTKSIKCPGCGKPAAGNFCSHCGTPVVTSCPACDADVEPGSRACRECGASLLPAAPKQLNAQAIAPWAAILIAMLALGVALAALFDRGSGAATPSPFSQLAPPAAPAPGQTVDLASLSPREAADRLYNRVMAASEKGDMAEALRFAPMALQAYDGLGALDNDARYHVALLRLTTEDINSARVQIEMLRQSAPKHLLAFMLEHQIAERSGKKDVAARATKAFLVAYDAELATGREEYRDHQGSIERFRAETQAGMTGRK